MKALKEVSELPSSRLLFYHADLTFGSKRHFGLV